MSSLLLTISDGVTHLLGTASESVGHLGNHDSGDIVADVSADL